MQVIVWLIMSGVSLGLMDTAYKMKLEDISFFFTIVAIIIFFGGGVYLFFK